MDSKWEMLEGRIAMLEKALMPKHGEDPDDRVKRIADLIMEEAGPSLHIGNEALLRGIRKSINLFYTEPLPAQSIGELANKVLFHTANDRLPVTEDAVRKMVDGLRDVHKKSLDRIATQNASFVEHIKTLEKENRKLEKQRDEAIAAIESIYDHAFVVKEGLFDDLP
jgi:hypothetical protein